MVGHNVSDETREKLRISNSGTGFGRKLPDSTRQRMSDGQKRRWRK
jgi:hypothetical protein